jgi:tetratricopeptide (TPR) repeat protein
MADRSNRFLTETAAMRTLTLSSPRGDVSFKIGLGVVALFAAVEFFSASYYYVGRISVPPTASQPSISSRPAVATPPPVTKKPIAAPSVAPTTAPVVAAAPPMTAPTASVASTSAVSAEERLLKEATELTNRGDTVNALNRLQQAAEKDPKNAQVLAEMAKIYESTQNFDRSNEMWRKVQEVGVSAGALYELAGAKLKRGPVATPAPPAVQATPADTFSFGAAEGIPDGSTFGVSDVVATETPDTEAETNLMLRISVKKRPNAVVDHTKVKIQVYFYDTVDDRDIKLTDADVNYEWLTPNHDWTQSNPEILAVTYLRQKNRALSQEAALSAAAASVNPNKKGKPVKAPTSDTADSGRRRYLGYIVRIYYNDKLQAVRADPTKLLNLFPPPSTTSSP